MLVAGVWACDRPYMLGLTPPEYLGEFFGLHNLTARLSSIAGTFVWGFVAATLGLGQAAAILVLIVCAVIAFVLIYTVRDRRAVEDAAAGSETHSG